MNTQNTQPINRQAAIFLSRKKRVETLGEAMERFASLLTDPEVAENIASMIANRKEGESPALTISVVIHRDEKTQNLFTARMKTNILTKLGEENLFGLK